MSNVNDVRKKVNQQMNGGLTVVLFGASGDLAKKKTFPALFRLFKNKLLPTSTVIIGYARSKLDHDGFVQRITENLSKEEDKKTVDDFVKICSYVSGQYDQDESFQHLQQVIGQSEDKRGMKQGQKNRIFYMALPPSVFLDVAKGCRRNVISPDDKSVNRVVIEKPFGKDLESCNELLSNLRVLFTENDTYRIDHYLGKEMVKNIIPYRFSNAFIHPLWNNIHIDSVQITLKEHFGTEGRGGYFDEFGIIRDVIQNHLLQTMSLVAMERPIGRGAEAIRDEKVKVLRCVKPIKIEDTLIGQYVANGDKPGYLDDDTVPKGSLCPTFAAMVLWIDNDRWDGVPFILKAGKALDKSKVEIRVQYKKVPGSLYGGVHRNETVMRIQPSEAIYTKFNNKSPGLTDHTMVTEMNLTYKDRFENLQIPDAYESLILDVMRSDHSNFVRDDELDAAWRIFTPVLHQLENEKIKPYPYKYGTRGPDKESEFVKKYGIEQLMTGYTWPKQDVEQQ
ncbi:glucose-6-phosphate dehydrogenase [Halteromyces radiatus]|uniref:glucose-6-phosphate dehydrogenase n=1 Tax=Halteromyces radiatus TaxID=101107 RepID=UPI00221FDF6F|nr:glucose-6-phosphate dehydrogenase [Halteromyces radiatus]KAI8084944.1 glucose-6-phosphate dehydrogenase [Halteromyces radiatus]